MTDSRKFLRKCIGCGIYKEKNELIKITKESKSGEIHINPPSNIYGRSCYICKDENCIDKAFKKLKISKALKKNTDTDLKEKISTVLEKEIVLQLY